MNSQSLRDLLVGLRNMIASGAETAKLLYFVDHLTNLSPRFTLDTLHTQLTQLHTHNTRTSNQLKETLRLNKVLEETRGQMQFELDCRRDKILALEKKLIEMRWAQQRRIRKERKMREKLDSQMLSVGALSHIRREKTSDTDSTLDEETIRRELSGESFECTSEGNSKQTSERASSEDSFSVQRLRPDNEEKEGREEQKGKFWLLTKSSQQYQILKGQ